ncbi:MAG: DUF362 domain-containing protein [Kiritimatiellae bacterium]|nr:DUF362 domain-containing protein [Kiritimatiellia bacterium]
MMHDQCFSFSRRDFIKTGAAGVAVLSAPVTLLADVPKPDVWVFHGADKTKLMKACLEMVNANGGFGKQTRSLALKVNAAWTRTPEEGANTHPDLVATFLKGAREFGVTKLDVPEHPCHRGDESFKRSGIRDAVKSAGAKMIDMKKEKKYFSDVTIPKGQSLTSARVTKHFLEADAVVNMPVAKHHGGATLTMAMKNWMGAVEDRRVWHRSNLHQCIADFSTFMKPAWTIIDATRIMMDKGPQGPAKTLKKPNLLVVSKDQVAADAYTATLFHDDPRKVKYLALAAEMGMGVIDAAQMNIHRVEVGV